MRPPVFRPGHTRGRRSCAVTAGGLVLGHDTACALPPRAQSAGEDARPRAALLRSEATRHARSAALLLAASCLRSEFALGGQMPRVLETRGVTRRPQPRFVCVLATHFNLV